MKIIFSEEFLMFVLHIFISVNYSTILKIPTKMIVPESQPMCPAMPTTFGIFKILKKNIVAITVKISP
jgi:hypothetical protein